MKTVKVVVGVLFLLSMLVLTSCTSIDSRLNDQIKKQSGVEERDEYITVSENVYPVDQEGYYSPEYHQNTTVERDPDKARFTFSKNAYIKTEWYKDPDFLHKLDENGCKLKQGEQIYVSTKLNRNIPSSAYILSKFRLMEIDENGDYYEVQTIQPSQNGFVLTVVEDYLGKELTIEPIGEYQKKEISFETIDENGNDIGGEWYVNDELVIGQSTEISSISSYTISCKFDAQEYFFASSEPECFYKDDDDGIVTFERKEATDETRNYSVKLHKYIKISIPSKELRYVNMNNGEEVEVKAGNSFEIPRLKYGQPEITIVTDIGWPEIERCHDLLLQNPDSFEISRNGQPMFMYKLLVAPPDTVFTFDPSEYRYDHGTIRFNWHGEEITSPTALPVNAKIQYEAGETEDGFYLPNAPAYITVSKSAEETKGRLNNIKFVEKVRAHVKLLQPKFGGKIDYIINGQTVNTDANGEFKTENGTIIELRFKPWEGWKCNYTNEDRYEVNEEGKLELVRKNGKRSDEDVSSNAFTEFEEHKPKLTVIISKSVGENMQFDFSEWLKKDTFSYKSGWFRSDYTAFKDEPIGTEKGIEISLKNSAIQQGTAVKILVEMTGEDQRGIKPVEVKKRTCRLVDSVVELQEPIKIYEDEELGNSSVWYKTIKITISKVNVVSFLNPAAKEHSSIQVRDDYGNTLNTGNLVEVNSNVTVMIRPDDRYYIEGKGIRENCYQQRFRYDKYDKEIQKIIAEHPIKKYINIRLKMDDSYGICTYKLNGNEITDSVYLRPGDKITLEYKTKEGYVIEGAQGFLGTSLGKNDREKTAALEVNDSYEGITLDRESFGIQVRKE